MQGSAFGRDKLLNRSSGLQFILEPMRPSNAEVVLAYRKLFKNGLHAIQYAKPQRYVLRDTMRRAFRNENPAEFNSERIENTVRFLENATRDNGIEHKVLKNLMHVRWWQTSLVRRRHRQRYVQSVETWT